MNQSSIFLIHTYLDLESLIPQLSKQILDQIEAGQNFQVQKNILPEDFSSQSIWWDKYLIQEKVIIPNWLFKEDIEKKLIDNEMLNFYKLYSKPTLIFLGDLSKLSLPVQESWLKFIEEPPKNLYPILFSPDIFTILPTIKSRCQIFNLDKATCLNFLDKKLLATCKKKYPNVGEFTVNFIRNIDTDLSTLIKAEREEINFWLWQVLQNLEAIYTEKPSFNVAQKIQKALLATRLNHDNLQKKIALGALSCGV